MIIIQKLSNANHHYDHLRHTMVDRQLRPNGIIEGRLLSAFHDVPREHFVFPAQKDSCYSDSLTTLKSGRFMLPALSLARLIQGMNLNVKSKVLVLACGLGYSVKILKHMGMNVKGIDLPLLIQIAIKNTPSLSENLVQGCLLNGCDKNAHYDAILIEGGVINIPISITNLLVDQGVLATLVFQKNNSRCSGSIFKKKDDQLFSVDVFDTAGYLLKEFTDKDRFYF